MLDPLTVDEAEAILLDVKLHPALRVSAVDPITAIRQRHHRIARMVAAGANWADISRLTGAAVATISRLADDPAFQNLVAYYQQEVGAEDADFIGQTRDLANSLVQHLADQLEGEPERFTPGITLEAIKVISDRAGYAPTQKTLNVNVNAGMGTRLKAARERALAAQADEVIVGQLVSGP